MWTNVVNDLNVEETVGTFYERELQENGQKEFRKEKVIKWKGDQLYQMERLRQFFLQLHR